MPALSSRDPEVRWRLSDVLTAQERFEEAKTQLDAARLGFDELLRRHLLAFADHAAEFYAGSGSDHRRALELARANVANRPTQAGAGDRVELPKDLPYEKADFVRIERSGSDHSIHVTRVFGTGRTQCLPPLKIK